MTDILTSEELKELRGCPECGERSVAAGVRPCEFSHDAFEGIRFRVRIPIWSCENCGFEYTDGRGEEIEHAAICRHLGRLTPREVRSIRKGLGLSRRDLARLTQFGEKSVKRWETGSLIQNASADRFLRLIQEPAVFKRLLNLDAELAAAQAAAVAASERGIREFAPEELGSSGDATLTEIADEDLREAEIEPPTSASRAGSPPSAAAGAEIVSLTRKQPTPPREERPVMGAHEEAGRSAPKMWGTFVEEVKEGLYSLPHAAAEGDHSAPEAQYYLIGEIKLDVSDKYVTVLEDRQGLVYVQNVPDPAVTYMGVGEQRYQLIRADENNVYRASGLDVGMLDEFRVNHLRDPNKYPIFFG